MKTTKRVALTLGLIGLLGPPSMLWATKRCTEPVQENHCMIGTWEAEATNAPELHNSAGGPSRWVGQEMGENRFVFNADGTFSQESTRPSTSRFQHQVGSASRQQQVMVTSRSTGRWSPSGDDGFLLCKETFEMKMGENAPSTPLPPEVVAAETEGEIAYRFQCEGDRAEITLLMPGVPEVSWTARRVEP